MADILEGLTQEDKDRLAEIQVLTMTNPKTRMEQQRLIRVAKPDQQLPELDAYERGAASEQKLREELAKRDTEISEIKMRGVRESLIQKLIDNGTMASRAQFEEIEKFGVENKIADYEKAAHFWKLSQQAAEPTTTTFPDSSPPALPVMEGLDKFKGSRSNWAENEAHKAWQELKSGKIRLPAQ